MSTNKIFCFGDGYAHGHIWPEWPQILEALLPEYKVIVRTGVGAGNEYLISELLALRDDIRNQHILFQWAFHNRFDKLVQDDQWKTIGEKDSIYSFNFYQHENRNWWLSSASTNSVIKKYHNFYIQDKQSELRYQNQQILLENYLQNNNCNYYFTSTEMQSDFSNQTKFTSIRGNEVQPSPILHFFFVTDIILPAINLMYSTTRAETLKNRILNQPWVAYDPDRTEIWEKIKDF